MIYITGDCHADFSKFDEKNFPEQASLTKDDYVIVCGDFGVWEETQKEKERMDFVSSRPFTTLFVDGNHENFDMLGRMEVKHWNGGDVHFVRPDIIHLMRGQIFNIDGFRFFTFGGARSHDISDGILELNDDNFTKKMRALNKRNASYRINHMSWWKEEMPSEYEYALGEQRLQEANWDVDFIITHCAPNSVQSALGRGFYKGDELTLYLESISKRAHFNKWFFGHYHDNKQIGEYNLIYDNIIKLEERMSDAVWR